MQHVSVFNFFKKTKTNHLVSKTFVAKGCRFVEAEATTDGIQAACAAASSIGSTSEAREVD
jgi:hypothetical protein